MKSEEKKNLKAPEQKDKALDDDVLDNVAGGISVSAQPTLEEMNWGKNNDQEDR